MVKKFLQTSVFVASIFQPDTGFSQRVVDNNTAMSQEQKAFLANLQKLAREISEGKRDEGLMSRLLNEKIHEFEKETKKARTRKPSYFYATVAGPKELGKPYAIVIDPDNQLVTVFTQVKVNEDGTLSVEDKEKAIIYAKNKKLRGEENNEAITNSAMVALNESQGAFTSRETKNQRSFPPQR